MMFTSLAFELHKQYTEKKEAEFYHTKTWSIIQQQIESFKISFNTLTYTE